MQIIDGKYYYIEGMEYNIGDALYGANILINIETGDRIVISNGESILYKKVGDMVYVMNIEDQSSLFDSDGKPSDYANKLLSGHIEGINYAKPGNGLRFTFGDYGHEYSIDVNGVTTKLQFIDPAFWNGDSATLKL